MTEKLTVESQSDKNRLIEPSTVEPKANAEFSRLLT